MNAPTCGVLQCKKDRRAWFSFWSAELRARSKVRAYLKLVADSEAAAQAAADAAAEAAAEADNCVQENHTCTANID